MVIDLAELSLFLATPAQVQASRRANHAHWGRGLELKAYLRRDELVDIYEHATDGKLMTWVLSPRNDPETLEFLCACETRVISFRRHAIVQEQLSHEPEQAFGYSIAAVFCPSHNRGKGYGRHMMRLLHYVLASPGLLPPFPSGWGSPPTPPPGTGNARFSTLWSDIDPMFYEKCGPNPNLIGWKVKDPIATIWPTDPTFHHSSDAHWLSEQDCIELWKQDALHIQQKVADRPKGSSACCAFLPDRGLAAFQMRRSKFFLPGLPSVPIPKKLGVVINDATYATWITDIRPLPVALLITRIRASPETLPVLLSAIMEAARENEVATVEVWNLESSLLETAHNLGGSTHELTTHFPALAWYGSGEVEDVQWLFNEKFCWC